MPLAFLYETLKAHYPNTTNRYTVSLIYIIYLNRHPVMAEKFEKHLTADEEGLSAVSLLANNTTLSKQQIKKAMTNGAVWLESKTGISRIRRGKKALNKGDTLHLYYDSKIQSQTPDAAVLIADEADYSIWNKPYGMYSQGSKWGDHCSIYRWAETHLEPARPAYLVHRLDRAASGLIILAHNKKTATAFAQMFKQHRITKKYRVTVEGDIGELELPFIIDTPLDGKAARTTILESTFNKNQRTSTVLVEITTGRKHQIRRHLSSLGYPVVGDRLYHATNTSLDLQLSSVHLDFDCPRDHIKRTYALS